MKQLVQAELFKLRKRPMTWILGGLAAALIAAVYALLVLAVQAADAAGNASTEFRASLAFVNTVTFGDSLACRIASLMAVILVGVSTGSEYRWRTVVTTSAWTGDPRRVLFARAAAHGLVALCWLALAYGAVIASSFMANAARGSLTANEVGGWVLADAALAWIRSAPVVLAYVALATCVATWSRSAAAGVAIPLAILFLEPLGAGVLREGGGLLQTVAGFTLSGNADALLAADGPVQGSQYGLPSGLPSAWRGAAALLLFSAMTAWLALRFVAHRDVTE